MATKKMEMDPLIGRFPKGKKQSFDDMGKPLPNPKPNEPKKIKPYDQRRPKGDTGIAEIYTEEVGKPPIDPDMGSMKKFSKDAKPFRKGGYVTKADGCAKRGKTKGRMV
jgi:hypothetical protein